MRILGLTGSIGMGKSTAAAMLRAWRLPVHDADAAVHRLLGPGGLAVAAVERVFPGVRRDGAIDRAALGARVFGRQGELRRLEDILHPLVRAEQQRFLARCRSRRVPLAVLDIPLLFETGGEHCCDGVVVVTAPRFLQKQRVLKRRGMTEERFRAISAQQLPDAAKRRRADWVVATGGGRRPALVALLRVLKELGSRKDDNQ